ncbi:MAG: Flp/Fap pilin component [Spirosoma sp.]|nr:Flp/Fap pilin component [Spirosoma sp.]
MRLAKFLSASRRLVVDEKGVTAVEYGVLGALIIVVCIAAITALGPKLNASFGSITF